MSTDTMIMPVTGISTSKWKLGKLGSPTNSPKNDPSQDGASSSLMARVSEAKNKFQLVTSPSGRRSFVAIAPEAASPSIGGGKSSSFGDLMKNSAGKCSSFMKGKGGKLAKGLGKELGTELLISGGMMAAGALFPPLGAVMGGAVVARIGFGIGRRLIGRTAARLAIRGARKIGVSKVFRLTRRIGGKALSFASGLIPSGIGRGARQAAAGVGMVMAPLAGALGPDQGSMTDIVNGQGTAGKSSQNPSQDPLHEMEQEPQNNVLGQPSLGAQIAQARSTVAPAQKAAPSMMPSPSRDPMTQQRIF